MSNLGQNWLFFQPNRADFGRYPRNWCHCPRSPSFLFWLKAWIGKAKCQGTNTHQHAPEDWLCGIRKMSAVIVGVAACLVARYLGCWA